MKCVRVHVIFKHSSSPLTFVSFTLGIALLFAFLLFLRSSEQLIEGEGVKNYALAWRYGMITCYCEDVVGRGFLVRSHVVACPYAPVSARS